MKLQPRILSDQHGDHGGVVHMKAVARSYMRWPGMDSNFEKLAKSCAAGQSVKSAPSAALCILGYGQISLGNEST